MIHTKFEKAQTLLISDYMGNGFAYLKVEANLQDITDRVLKAIGSHWITNNEVVGHHLIEDVHLQHGVMIIIDCEDEAGDKYKDEINLTQIWEY